MNSSKDNNLYEKKIDNEIIIFENFLNEKDLLYVKEYVNDQKFKFGHQSGYKERIVNEFFSFLNLNDFFTKYLKNKIEISCKKKFNLFRSYMHIQTFGQDGGYHVDSFEPNTYTFCIYITNINESDIDNASGEFFIKIPNKNYIISVEPLCNRGIFFPSNYLHKGMAFNRFYKDKRLCITWKLIETN
jgi:hypothetical protein